MLKAANEKDIFIVTQMNLAVIMSVLLDSEPLTKTHLKDLIKQSQVELIALENEKEEKNQIMISLLKGFIEGEKDDCTIKSR